MLRRAQAAATNPRCGGLRLPALLLTPVQRIPRYLLLLKDFMDKTDPDHPDMSGLRAAYDKVSDLASLVNNSLRASQDQKTMADLRKNIAGLLLLETAGRTLVREGPVNLVRPRKPYRCVLFNDLLVFAEQIEVRPGGLAGTVTSA